MASPTDSSVAAPFASQMATLEATLERGIQKLLAEVRRRGITQPPYGRPTPKSPLLTEEDFVKQLLTSQSNAAANNTDSEPVFEFDYGFNPLKFLGDYVLWSHPSSLAERELEKQRAAERLRYRAQHAAKQLVVLQSLKQIAQRQASGIVWGPVTSPCPSSSSSATDTSAAGLEQMQVTAVFQAIREGTAYLLLSTDDSFSEVSQTIKVACSSSVPTKVVISELSPGTRYYLRICLEESASSTPETVTTTEGDDGSTSEPIQTRFMGLEMNVFRDCGFWTLPSPIPSQLSPSGEEKFSEKENEAEEDLGFSPISMLCLSADTCQLQDLNVDVVPENGFVITALLGDVFPSMAPDAQEAAYKLAAWRTHRASALMNAQGSPCINSSLLIGWHDCSFKSDVAARSEEITYKQFQSDTSKYTKKYGTGKRKASTGNASKVPPPQPVLNRPPLSLSFSSIVEAFPIDFSESAVRHIYRSFLLGPDVEAFVLDFRSGYLCKDQAKWLKEKLSTSRALWKIVFSGMPIALMPGSESSNEPKRPILRERLSSTLILDSNAFGQQLNGGEQSVSKGVQMDVPDVPENRDVDEYGRAKNSLPYLIFSMQRTAIRNKQLLEEGANDDASVTSADVTASVSPSINTLEIDDAPLDSVDGAPAKEAPETIESGIVFVTGNNAHIGHPGRPYVATFDPLKSGRSFCAEVNVGSIAPPSVPTLRPAVTPLLETRFLDGDEVSLLAPATPDQNKAPSAHTCLVRLERSGQLSIKLLALDTRGAPAEVVYKKSFRA